MKSEGLPQVSAVFGAAARIRKVIRNTPLVVPLDIPDSTCGQQVWFKAENLQKTGSFKIRGALNKLMVLKEEAALKKRQLNGVVTDSSGNHGQGLAYAASMLGVSCTVVVPSDASRSKVEAIKGHGAEVIAFGSSSTEREQEALRISQTRGLTYVSSYDDPDIIAGQGTIATEIVTSMPDVGMILVPVGNGGLIAGVSMAVKSLHPSCLVIGVEPEGSCSMYKSRQAGRPVELETVNTIADGLRGKRPGDLTFPIAQKYVDDIVLVSEGSISESFRKILFGTKMLAEPSGAAAYAAVLSGSIRPGGKKVVALISGGNVDAEVVTTCLYRCGNKVPSRD